MRQKQIASCFLGYLKDINVNLIICAVTNLNAHISKWIFLAYALFWRTRSHIQQLSCVSICLFVSYFYSSTANNNLSYQRFQGLQLSLTKLKRGFFLQESFIQKFIASLQAYRVISTYLHGDQSPLLNKAPSQIKVGVANAGEKIKPSLEYKTGLFPKVHESSLLQMQQVYRYMYMQSRGPAAVKICLATPARGTGLLTECCQSQLDCSNALRKTFLTCTCVYDYAIRHEIDCSAQR